MTGDVRVRITVGETPDPPGASSVAISDPTGKSLPNPGDSDHWSALSNTGQATASGSPWRDAVYYSLRSRPDADGDVQTSQSAIEIPYATAAAWSRDEKSLWVATDDPLGTGRRLVRINVTGNHEARADDQVSGIWLRGASHLAGVVVGKVPGEIDNTKTNDAGSEFVAVSHLVPKAKLPSTQIEQGWVFTNAITLITFDGNGKPLGRLVPLDTRTRGFANPAAIVASRDGAWLYVAHRGTSVVSVVDVGRALTEIQPQPLDADPEAVATGSYDAPDLTRTRRYVPRRIAVPHPGGALALSPDGTQLAVTHPLAGRLSIVNVASGLVQREIDLRSPATKDRSTEKPADAEPVEASSVARDELVREGERLFHSGELGFNGQFSCASCHPRGETDGLAWDLPADGFNNFLNTKSLVSVSGTAPYGWFGGSPTLEDRIRGTLRGLFQHEPTDQELRALAAYVGSLSAPARVPPVDTPDAVGSNSPGRTLFHGVAGCADCHSGTKYTDRRRHDLGLSGEYDTPSLLGVSRTGPWLHDGRAETLESIFRKHDPSQRHGATGDLTDPQLRELLDYVKSR